MQILFLDWIFSCLAEWISEWISETGLQTFGSALVTILISLAIFFVQNNKTIVEVPLVERIKILISFKLLGASMLLIFVPLIFWDSDFKSWDSDFKSDARISILFTFYVLGVICFVYAFARSYWLLFPRKLYGGSIIDSREFYTTARYLKKSNFFEQKYIEQKYNMWEKFWKQSNNVPQEKLMSKVFMDKVAKIKRNNDFRVLQDYIYLFYENIEKRPLSDLSILKEFLSEFLKLYYRIFTKEKNIKGQEEAEYSIVMTKRTLKNIFAELTKSAIVKGDSNADKYFEELQKQIKSCDKSSDKEGTRDIFVNPICRTFFEEINDSKDSDYIWKDCFPQEWKVTHETLTNKDNYIAKIWWNEFKELAQGSIRRKTGPGLIKEFEFDKSLDNVTKNLFPEVDPASWAEILTILMRPWFDNKRMRSLIEGGVNFGWYLRTIDSSGNDDEDLAKFNEQEQLERQNTLKLAFLLFGDYFTVEVLKGFIVELKNLELEYARESKEYRSCKVYIKLIKEMLDWRKENIEE